MRATAFDRDTVEAAFRRAGGKCECVRIGHGHIGRCNKPLQAKDRGKEFGLASWQARHKIPEENGGGDTVANCVILCWSCHKKTQ